MVLHVRPAVIWLTGLSGAGKSTIAYHLIKQFKLLGTAPVILDGDQIRRSLKQNKFDETSRKAHNLHVGKMAAGLEEKGKVVIVSLISPYADIRDQIRSFCQNFIEVYINTPLDLCIHRDPKGLYKKALSGEIQNFTGLTAPYFPPTNPEITICTDGMSVLQCSEQVIRFYLAKEKKPILLH